MIKHEIIANSMLAYLSVNIENRVNFKARSAQGQQNMIASTFN